MIASRKIINKKMHSYIDKSNDKNEVFDNNVDLIEDIYVWHRILIIFSTKYRNIICNIHHDEEINLETEILNIGISFDLLKQLILFLYFCFESFPEV